MWKKLLTLVCMRPKPVEGEPWRKTERQRLGPSIIPHKPFPSCFISAIGFFPRTLDFEIPVGGDLTTGIYLEPSIRGQTDGVELQRPRGGPIEDVAVYVENAAVAGTVRMSDGVLLVWVLEGVYCAPKMGADGRDGPETIRSVKDEDLVFCNVDEPGG